MAGDDEAGYDVGASLVADASERTPNGSSKMRFGVVIVTALAAAPVLAAEGCSDNADGPVVQPMTQVTFVTQPSAAEGQVAFAPAVRVAIQDIDGNTVTTASADITVTLAVNPGAARLVGDSIVHAVGGIATFSRLGVSRAGDGFALRAQATGLLPDSSKAFAVHLTFVSVTAGSVLFVQVSSGDSHTCGISTDSVAYCWGDNFYGQLGDSTRTPRAAPTATHSNLKFVLISAGQLHTGAGTAAHAAYCWGWGGDGAVGDDSVALRVVPSAVSGSLTFAQITAGWTHSCGVTTTGTGYCWGKNPNGAVGDSGNAPHFSPTLVAAGHTFAQIKAGNEFTCGLTTNQGLYCWGFNVFGQVGDGTNNDRYAPTRVVQ